MALDVLTGLEFLVLFLAAFLSKFLYFDVLSLQDQINENYGAAALICVLLYYVFGQLLELRNRQDFPQRLFLPKRLFGALACSFLALLAVGFLLKVSSDFSRGWLVTWFALACSSLLCLRLAVSNWACWMQRRGFFRTKVAILGSTKETDELADTFQQHDDIDIVGVFSDDEDPISQLGNLIKLGQQTHIDEIIVVSPKMTPENFSELNIKLSVLPVAVKFCAHPIAYAFPNCTLVRSSGVNLLEVSRKPISDWGFLFKLVLDFVLSAILLLALAPLFLLIAAAIRLESKGPVFFRQQRHGYNHRSISVIKFRTMTVTENGNDVKQAQKDDDRVTKVGQFLRRTSLDEIPQLINVIRGEMSLVGPRPHAEVHNHFYSEMLDTYANRHRVRPGITGWAQIHGLRGPTETVEKMQKRIEYDLYYIDNWSPWLDLKILLTTPLIVIFGTNAF